MIYYHSTTVIRITYYYHIIRNHLDRVWPCGLDAVAHVNLNNSIPMLRNTYTCNTKGII